MSCGVPESKAVCAMPKTASSLLGMIANRLNADEQWDLQHAQNTRRGFGHGTKSMEFSKGFRLSDFINNPVLFYGVKSIDSLKKSQ